MQQNVYNLSPTLSVAFNNKGQLQQMKHGDMVLSVVDFKVDIGVNGQYVCDSIAFESFLDFYTWSLPVIQPQRQKITASFSKTRKEGKVLSQDFSIGELEITKHFTHEDDALKLWVEIKNTGTDTLWINGTLFDLVLALPEATTFDFPGNLPYGTHSIQAMEPLEPVETGLVNTVTHFEFDGQHINNIYINPAEKWGTAVFLDNDRNVHYHCLAGTELLLAPGESYLCGDLFVQLTEKAERFSRLRDFYKAQGYVPPTDGLTEGIVYSGHPTGGTFMYPVEEQKKLTLQEYKKELNMLADMGVDLLWLLPLFDHYEEADPQRNVYTPTDQLVIDSRYGTDKDMKEFVEYAATLGIKVLFDYVPHGPRPHDPDGIKYVDTWASLKQDGTPQIEWTCLSFDMANPTYLEYMKDVVRSHIDRFGIEGTRIDCAMGGLSNWKPYENNRPSNSNMMGGVAMSKHMRDAFVEKGIVPFVTPENFHPIPLYYSSTDAYYDMALYRVLHDLNKAEISRKKYVFELTRWLDHQNKSTPETLGKMRFLGNHDTVSWVWDEARATDIYGMERAKAMWVLISFIDGFPMIYQGDENPEWYNQAGPDLIEFFTELFTTRKQLVDNTYDIEYLYTDSPVFAYLRTKAEDSKLVVINLGDTEQTFSYGNLGEVLYGNATIKQQMIHLQANQSAVITLIN